MLVEVDSQIPRSLHFHSFLGGLVDLLRQFSSEVPTVLLYTEDAKFVELRSRPKPVGQGVGEAEDQVEEQADSSAGRKASMLLGRLIAS